MSRNEESFPAHRRGMADNMLVKLFAALGRQERRWTNCQCGRYCPMDGIYWVALFSEHCSLIIRLM